MMHDAGAEVGNQIFHLWAPNDILQLSKSTLHHQTLSIVCMGSKKKKKEFDPLKQVVLAWIINIGA